MATGSRVHVWHRCHHCGAFPIVGERHECQTCPVSPDTSLCSECYELYLRGEVTHPVGHVRSHQRQHQFIGIAGPRHNRHLQWIRVRALQAPPPKVPKGSLIRPEFCFGNESTFGAYGCVVATERGNLVLTALHVLDEVSKKHGIDTTMANPNYTGEELPRVIDRVHLYDVLADRWMLSSLGSASQMLVLPEARSNVEEPLAFRDISAFVADADAQVHPLQFAEEAPDVGESVWLAAKYANGSRTRRAVVVEKTDLSYVFRFDASGEGPPYTSGAPILNERGEIVGVNVGAGRFGTWQFGHAIHIENIRAHLHGGMNWECVAMAGQEDLQWSQQRY